MADRRINIVYESGLKRFSNDDESFEKGILRVAYSGKNRNGSFISKETFEKCINTIYNKPIVCNYNRETDSIGAHDSEIVQTPNGGLKLVNVTQPVGVVPESANWWWEEIVEDSGEVHEYLCCDILIWKREEAYEHIKANKITDESMEIRVKSGHTADDLFYIDSFEFTAFCLLESAVPCFESACIEVFSLTEFRDLYHRMMEDFAREFQSVTTSKGDDINPHNNTNLSKGGDIPLNKTEILQQFGLTPETVGFNIDELTEDELRSKLQDMKDNHQFDDTDGGDDNTDPDEGDDGTDPDTEPDEGPEDDGDDDTAATGTKRGQFSLTAEQFRDELIASLRKVTYIDRWMDVCPRYSYVDYDAEKGEVYCYDIQEGWTLYGFSFSQNGDSIVIDFESKKRKKFSIVDFDEGSDVQNYQAAFTEYCERLAEKKDGEIKDANTAAEKKFAELNNQIKTLKEYQNQKMSDERQEAETALFEEFSELDGIEAFEDLKSNCSGMTLEEVESKCFEIKGRNDKVLNFAANKPKSVRLPAGRPNAKDRMDENEPYGGIFLEYGSRQ